MKALNRGYKLKLLRDLLIYKVRNLTPEFAELGCVVFELMLAFWLLMPFDTFGSAPVFNSLRDLADENYWALALLLYPAITLMGVVRDSYKWRRNVMLGTALLWGVFDTMLGLSNIRGILFPIFFVVTGLCIWTYALLGQEMREVEELQSNDEE